MPKGRGRAARPTQQHDGNQACAKKAYAVLQGLGTAQRGDNSQLCAPARQAGQSGIDHVPQTLRPFQRQGECLSPVLSNSLPDTKRFPLDANRFVRCGVDSMAEHRHRHGSSKQNIALQVCRSTAGSGAENVSETASTDSTASRK